MFLRLTVSAALVSSASGALATCTLAHSTAAVLHGGGGSRARLFASSAVAENPLLEQDGLPRFGSIDAVHVKDAISVALTQMDESFAALEDSLTSPDEATYDKVVEAMEKVEAPVEYSWGVVNHLMGVKNSDDLRSAHGEMQGEVIKKTTKLGQSLAVYKALEAIAKDEAALEPAQRRIVAASLASMKLGGVGLEGDAKETFNTNRLRLGELSTDFSNNLMGTPGGADSTRVAPPPLPLPLACERLRHSAYHARAFDSRCRADATKAFSLTLSEASQVEGLPPSALALAASRAVEAGESRRAAARVPPQAVGLPIRACRR